MCGVTLFGPAVFTKFFIYFFFSLFSPWYILPKSGSNWADFKLNSHSPFWSVARAVPYSSMCPDVATVTWFIYQFLASLKSSGLLLNRVTPKNCYPFNKISTNPPQTNSTIPPKKSKRNPNQQILKNKSIQNIPLTHLEISKIQPKRNKKNKTSKNTKNIFKKPNDSNNTSKK